MKKEAKKELMNQHLQGKITTPALIAGIKLVEYKYTSKKGLRESELKPMLEVLYKFFPIVENWKQIIILNT